MDKQWNVIKEVIKEGEKNSLEGERPEEIGGKHGEGQGTIEGTRDSLMSYIITELHVAQPIFKVSACDGSKSSLLVQPCQGCAWCILQ